MARLATWSWEERPAFRQCLWLEACSAGWASVVASGQRRVGGRVAKGPSGKKAVLQLGAAEPLAGVKRD
jgi:hypothetical protein